MDVSSVKLTGLEAYRNLQAIMSQKQRKIPFEEDIIRRFQLCVFFLIRSECERTKRTTLAKSLSPFLHNDDKIAYNIKQWTVAGAVFTGLAQQLGGYGVLLVLPTRDVPRSAWEIYLSRSTPRFQEVSTL